MEKDVSIDAYIDNEGGICVDSVQDYGKYLYTVEKLPVFRAGTPGHSVAAIYIEANTNYEELIKKDNWMVFDQNNRAASGSRKRRKELKIYWERDKTRIRKAIKDLDKILKRGTITKKKFENIKEIFSKPYGLGGKKLIGRRTMGPLIVDAGEYEIQIETKWTYGTGFAMYMPPHSKEVRYAYDSLFEFNFIHIHMPPHSKEATYIVAYGRELFNLAKMKDDILESYNIRELCMNGIIREPLLFDLCASEARCINYEARLPIEYLITWIMEK